MITAVIYARYSSDSQSEQSIEGQLRVCQEYAERNNIVVVDTYIDRAMTGTNDNRPEFRRMLKDSAKRNWEAVLVYKLDRFARNLYESVNNRKKLEDNGVKLMSAMENIPDTSEGKLFRAIIEGYNEYYSEDVRQKVKRGMNESRQKGHFTGGYLIYGYKVVNRKIVIDEEKADVVRYIYEQYHRGVYIKDIMAELQKKGIYNNGKPFAKNTVYNILKNEKYSGIYRYKEEIFDNIYPQIVPQDIYQSVRAKTVVNHKGSRSVEVIYILRNKLKCGYCGQSISAECGTSKTGKKERYYKCYGRKNGNSCKKTNVRKQYLEDFIVGEIVDRLKDKTVVNHIVKQIMKIQEQDNKENSMLQLLLKEKRATETALSNILNAIEQGIVSKTTNQRLHELEMKDEELERKIAVEKNKQIINLTEKEIKQYYEQALKLEPLMLINYLIKEIVLYDDKVEIHYNSPLKEGPDENRDFSFYTGKGVIYNETQHPKKIYKQEMGVEMYVR